MRVAIEQRRPSERRALVAGLTLEQRRAYWRYTAVLTAVLLAAWFVVTFLLAGLLADDLEQVTVLGFPLGYWVAAQGTLILYLAEVALYARLMNARDARHEGGAS